MNRHAFHLLQPEIVIIYIYFYWINAKEDIFSGDLCAVHKLLLPHFLKISSNSALVKSKFASMNSILMTMHSCCQQPSLTIFCVVTYSTHFMPAAAMNLCTLHKYDIRTIYTALKVSEL